jgi:hypothetical protein
VQESKPKLIRETAGAGWSMAVFNGMTAPGTGAKAALFTSWLVFCWFAHIVVMFRGGIHVVAVGWIWLNRGRCAGAGR